MRCEYEKKVFSSIVEFNPQETLKKGTKAKKIAMDKLQPFCRDITEYEIEEFKGGSKFRNGDTIMARITPCLENGKTAKVSILDNNEVGFGSTEYIVFRAKDGVDEDYLYYLVCSNVVREPAIKSMVGSSGRQRVQLDVLKELEVQLPPYDIQCRIGNILRCIDDKIELNRKINKNLEDQVSAIYQSYFENFKFATEGKNQNWNYQEFSTIAHISSGKRPQLNSKICNQKTPIPIVGATSVMGFTSEPNYNDKILIIGRVGTHGIVQRITSPCWASDNTLVITSPYYEFVNQILHRIDYSSINRGSTQPLITQKDMKTLLVLVPNEKILMQFEEIASSLMAQCELNKNENLQLSHLRDILLPKLMSGELDVSALDI